MYAQDGLAFLVRNLHLRVAADEQAIAIDKVR